MQAKRVAIIIDHLCLNVTGGIHTYQREMLRALAEPHLDDIEITLVGFNLSKMVKKYPFLSRFSLLDIPNRNIPLYFDFRHFVLVPLRLGNIGFDVVIEPTQSVPFLFKKYGLIAIVMDLTPLVVPGTHKNTLISYLRHRLLLGMALRRCDSIMAISQNTKKDIVEHLRIDRGKISVANPGVPERQGETPIDVRTVFGLPGDYILSVGTIEPRKNYPTLIRAFDRLLSTGCQEDLDLVIVGRRGWKSEATFSKLASSAFRDRIHILERVGERELASLYRECLFFVFPSLYEGFGIPVLEAMSFGKAVVISNTSSMAEFPVDDGFKFDPNDPEALEEIMRSMTEGGFAREESGKRNSKLAEAYFWSTTVSTLIELIQKC